MNWKDVFPKENRYFETENGILYYGYCLDILQKLPDKSVDLVLTGTPYVSKVNKYSDDWDKQRPDKIYFDEIFRIAKNVMIFGGNYFDRTIPLLIDLLTDYSDENNIILDPFLGFLGSGTTGVACEKLNRRWIGIEINLEYCEIAKQRILGEIMKFR